MKKISTVVGLMLLCSWANAQQFDNTDSNQIDYGDYSASYRKCLQNTPNARDCDIEEYYHLKKSADELINKLISLPVVAQYNNTDFSLKKNVEERRKYSEILCETLGTIVQNEETTNECKMDKENTLYVDLYKLYEASQKNNPRTPF